MSVYQRSLIKQHVNFYRDYYRRFVMASLFSFMLSFLLLLAILYVHVNRPSVQFYASNTAGFITPLKPLAEPNMTDNYLLPPDPVEVKTVNKFDLER